MITDIFLIIFTIIIFACALVCAVGATVGFILMIIEFVRVLRKK